MEEKKDELKNPLQEKVRDKNGKRRNKKNKSLKERSDSTNEENEELDFFRGLSYYGQD